MTKRGTDTPGEEVPETAPVSLDEARRVWAEVVASVETRNRAAYALIKGSQAVGADGSGVYVRLTPPSRAKKLVLDRRGPIAVGIDAELASRTWVGAWVRYRLDPEEEEPTLEELWERHSAADAAISRVCSSVREKGPRGAT